jgi:hypothetical protein
MSRLHPVVNARLVARMAGWAQHEKMQRWALLAAARHIHAINEQHSLSICAPDNVRRVSVAQHLVPEVAFYLPLKRVPRSEVLRRLVRCDCVCARTSRQLGPRGVSGAAIAVRCFANCATLVRWQIQPRRVTRVQTSVWPGRRRVSSASQSRAKARRSYAQRLLQARAECPAAQQVLARPARWLLLQSAQFKGTPVLTPRAVRCFDK